MNTKRNYPLFIIDSSRSHGRGSETDYISCTSNECPFVGKITLHEDNEYRELYNPDDYRTIWSDPQHGIRLRIQVVSQLPHGTEPSLVRSLLRRALKEVLLRHHSKTINLQDVTDEDIVAWADTFLLQVKENLREDPNEKYQKMHYAVLTAIKERFHKS